MSEKSTEGKLVEAHAEALQDESALFNGDETTEEVVRVILEQVRGVRDEHGNLVTAKERDVEQKQVELRGKMGLPKKGPSCPEEPRTGPISRKQAELKERFFD